MKSRSLIWGALIFSKEYVMKRFLKKHLRILVVVLLSLALLSALSIVVWGAVGSYAPEDIAYTYLTSGEKVTVTDTRYFYFLDGAGNDTAMIFYPGAFVDEEAYSPILYKLAEQGVDCFLMKLPHNFAIMDPFRANKVFDAGYEYAHWYISGHSLGGVCAATCVNKYPERFDGLVFLASYASEDISNVDIPVLSILGTDDGIVSASRLEEGRELLPSDTQETSIPGGTHSGFGAYGVQKNDNPGGITHAEQWDITAKLIMDFINK